MGNVSPLVWILQQGEMFLICAADPIQQVHLELAIALKKRKC